MDLVEQKIHQKTKAKYKMGFLKKSCIFIVIITIMGYLVWENDDFQRKFLYPYPYKSTVSFYADRYKLDESLVAGLILAESKFKPEAISPHGAIGLMQIMPETATWIAHQIEDESFSIDKLSMTKINIKYGTWYLASLKEEFDDNDVLALAAYNAGRGNVHEWIEEYGWDRDFSDYNQIPFPETRAYVKQVLENQKQYHSLYK